MTAPRPGRTRRVERPWCHLLSPLPRGNDLGGCGKAQVLSDPRSVTGAPVSTYWAGPSTLRLCSGPVPFGERLGRGFRPRPAIASQRPATLWKRRGLLFSVVAFGCKLGGLYTQGKGLSNASTRVYRSTHFSFTCPFWALLEHIGAPDLLSAVYFPVRFDDLW